MNMQVLTRVLLAVCLSVAAARAATAQTTATISGRLTEALTGAPVSAGHISLIEATTGALPSTQTAADGTYSLNLPAGTYRVRAYGFFGNPPVPYVTQTYGGVNCLGQCYDPGRSFTLVAGETRTMNFALQPSAVIEGSLVSAESGAPLAGSVTLYDAAYRSVGYAETSNWPTPTGSFRITGNFPTGTYYLVTGLFGGQYRRVMYDGVVCAPGCRLGDATPIKAVSGQTVRLTVRVPPVTSAPSISGRITDAITGAPLGGVHVYANDPGSPQGLGFATSDGAGNYSIRTNPGPKFVYAVSSPGGGYLTSVYRDRPLIFWEDVRAGTAVQVPATGSIGGIDFQMRRGGSIAGRVTGPTPKQSSNSFVSIAHESGVNVATVAVSADGTYQVGGLLPGRYVATYNGPGSQLYNGLPCHQCPVTSGTKITVVEGGG